MTEEGHSDALDGSAYSVYVQRVSGKGNCLMAGKNFAVGDVMLVDEALLWASWDEEEESTCFEKLEAMPHSSRKALDGCAMRLAEELGELSGDLDRSRLFLIAIAMHDQQASSVASNDTESKTRGRGKGKGKGRGKGKGKGKGGPKARTKARAAASLSLVEPFSSLVAVKKEKCLQKIHEILTDSNSNSSNNSNSNSNNKAVQCFGPLRQLAVALGEENLAHILGALNGNSHTLEEKGGSALFPTASMCEHSCHPNASFTTTTDTIDATGTGKSNHAQNISNPIKLVLCAIDAIEKGDSISLDYVNMYASSRAQRREELWINYGFVCQCRKCMIEPDTSRAFTCPLFCSSTSTSVSAATSNDNHNDNLNLTYMPSSSSSNVLHGYVCPVPVGGTKREGEDDEQGEEEGGEREEEKEVYYWSEGDNDRFCLKCLDCGLRLNEKDALERLNAEKWLMENPLDTTLGDVAQAVFGGENSILRMEHFEIFPVFDAIVHEFAFNAASHCTMTTGNSESASNSNSSSTRSDDDKYLRLKKDLDEEEQILLSIDNSLVYEKLLSLSSSECKLWASATEGGKVLKTSIYSRLTQLWIQCLGRLLPDIHHEWVVQPDKVAQMYIVLGDAITAQHYYQRAARVARFACGPESSCKITADMNALAANPPTSIADLMSRYMGKS